MILLKWRARCDFQVAKFRIEATQNETFTSRDTWMIKGKNCRLIDFCFKENSRNMICMALRKRFFGKFCKSSSFPRWMNLFQYLRDQLNTMNLFQYFRLWMVSYIFNFIRIETIQKKKVEIIYTHRILLVEYCRLYFKWTCSMIFLWIHMKS